MGKHPHPAHYRNSSPAEIRQKVAAYQAHKQAARRRGGFRAGLLLAGLLLAGAWLLRHPHRLAHRCHFSSHIFRLTHARMKHSGLTGV